MIFEQVRDSTTSPPASHHAHWRSREGWTKIVAGSLSVNKLRRRLRARQAWKRYSTLTMVERAHFLQNLHLAVRQVRSRGLKDGCFVECGTWAGRMSFGMMHVLPEIKLWHFFDSYEGLPPATALDGLDALRQQQQFKSWHENNTADHDTFAENAKRARRPDQQFEVRRGWFQDTLPVFTAERPISVLRMDGDWYDSTMAILDCLYDPVSEGGLLLIDDYQAWPGCSRAVHGFFSKRNAGEVIRECRGVFYLVRDRQRDRL